ncbi:ATP-binding protein [Ottowia sp.]|uniref:sensor histidine kinase n=1 Tax=Ottowia sp. TaxID=1898956 RepID=UPI002CD919CC|nr:ATP-binding protein [Ottowia sp.]HRN76832.1 ATP-binding protein [Ottowia sp.]
MSGWRSFRCLVAGRLRRAILLLALVLGACVAPAAAARIIEAGTAAVVLGSGDAPPGDTAAWRTVTLPDDAGLSRPSAAEREAWYRIDFELSSAHDAAPWALYLPYLYYGGDVWLNGVEMSAIPLLSDRMRVWAYRPRLVSLPAPALRAGANRILIRVAQAPGLPLRFPVVSIGPEAELQPIHERRLFWTRVVPQFSVLASLLAGAWVLLIWARRPQECLYGLFGIAALLWSVRSLNFTIDSMTLAMWNWWRLVFHCSTAAFVIVMAWFTLRLAGIRAPRIERGLLALLLVGPVWYATQGFDADMLVARWWMASLIPVALGIVAVSFWIVWKQRTLTAALLPVAMTVAVAFGIHDYLLTFHPPLLAWLVSKHWVGQRIFMMHYGTDALLLAMGALLTARFIDSLKSLENFNQTLESRIADRERLLAANFEQLTRLQISRAAADERQLIMRDLHDGLGSRLCTTLLRVERGAIATPQIADMLRACIADMRIALDALASQEADVATAVGEFMYRWNEQLISAGIQPSWDIELGDTRLPLAPHATHQLLRIAQEALANALKHSGATALKVALRRDQDRLELRIEDNGHGFTARERSIGRGLANMRQRAQGLGGSLSVQSDAAGTALILRVPLTTENPPHAA